MFREIAYFLIFGKPLIMYLGITTLLSFLLTASVGLASVKGIKWWIPFKWHPIFAAISIGLALIHGFLGASLYF